LIDTAWTGSDGTDTDVIALSEDPLEVAVQIFYVRGGRIRGERGFIADKADGTATTGDLVSRFIQQTYAGDSGDALYLVNEITGHVSLAPDAGNASIFTPGSWRLDGGRLRLEQSDGQRYPV
jgi:excinuclease UvrABC nuclease subunit